MAIALRKMERLLLQIRGTIVASNDESLLGQDTAGNQVVQAMKEHTDSQHIFHLKMKEPEVTESC